MSKTKVFLLHDYFYPAIRAGGPVVSCVSLVSTLKERIDFAVFTRAFDYDGSRLDVAPDRWSEVHGAQVFYADRKSGLTSLYRELKNRQPDVIYLNGIYSSLVLSTLLVRLVFFRNVKLILCARGMLMPRAVAQKKWKKLMFLIVSTPLFRQKMTWHFTSEREQQSHPRYLLTRDQRIEITPNLPVEIDVDPPFHDGEKTRLVTVALISPMKNIHVILKSLSRCESRIEYRLYGPIKDQNYWRLCEKLIADLPANIEFSYEGEVLFDQIGEVLHKAEVYIQPSESENFGHSLFEALQVGLAVITSTTTPWNDLHDSGCGINVEPGTCGEITDYLDSYATLSMEERTKTSMNAKEYAKRSLSFSSVEASYVSLFTRDMKND
jgi:glycosyltransferase involved in cell wall biosynthesis